MTTLTYNSAGLSVKDRLVIANLLGLFESRLNGKWVSADPSGDQPSHVVLIDLDHPDGAKRWEAASRHRMRVAVTANETGTGPFISHPIRAFGPNGVVVLFNSLAPLLALPSPETRAIAPRDPARIRMTGRLEASSAPVRPTRPLPPVAPLPSVAPLPPLPRSTQPSAAAPQPPPLPTEPVRRVAIQWGPPKPLSLPPLTRMPGARIHRFGAAPSEPEVYDFPLQTPSQSAPIVASVVEFTQPTAPEHAPSGRSEGYWRPPEVAPPRPLLSMPTAHRPVEIHSPPGPIIGRARVETQPVAEPQRAHRSEDTLVLRSSPPTWKRPEAEAFKELIDFKSLTGPPASAPPEPELRLAEPEIAANAPSEEIAAPENLEVAPTASGGLDVLALPEAVHLPEVPDVAGIDSWFAATAEAESEGPAPVIEQGQDLQRLAQSLGEESPAEEMADDDADADWWGTPEGETGSTDQRPSAADENSLFAALKSIKLSGQPGILEIPGLPAVCVIPSRNIYLTTAPAARIELAAGTQTGITWRACSSEAEARQLSGTDDSRQASLEQLSWTASLLDSPADPAEVADQAVRLRRWPPITESRGRSKFLRYATLLSGALATPRELAQITGDPVEEIVGFVSACSKMNLLESVGSSKAPTAHTPARTAGAGILRDMIEQLTPPKI